LASVGGVSLKTGRSAGFVRARLDQAAERATKRAGDWGRKAAVAARWASTVQVQVWLSGLDQVGGSGQ
jgi:hypothetical protein